MLFGRESEHAAQPADVYARLSGGFSFLHPVVVVEERRKLFTSLLGLRGLERGQIPQGRDLLQRPFLEIMLFQVLTEGRLDFGAGVELFVLLPTRRQFLRRPWREVIHLAIKRLLQDEKDA